MISVFAIIYEELQKQYDLTTKYDTVETLEQFIQFLKRKFDRKSIDFMKQKGIIARFLYANNIY